jgi:fluoroacetyl-CoA thioesterase
MAKDLPVGLTNTSTYVVTPEMGPPHLDVAVLSTPWMLGLVEMTSLRAIAAELGPDETIVGTGATLTHDAAVLAGDEVTITSTLIGSGRRLTFDAEITTARTAGPVRVGTITLESAVIDKRRFAR